MYYFYEFQAIEKKLSEMAERGWMIEKMGLYFWTYRPIEPKKISFAAVYSPKLAEFAPDGAEELEQLKEYGAWSGWKHAARWNGKLQVFYNEDPDPIPMETDAAVQLENIHKAMKKTMLVGNTLLAGLAVLQLLMQGKSFFKRAADTFCDYSQISLFTAWVFLLIAVLLPVFKYLFWYGKAKKTAAEGFLPDSSAGHTAVNVFSGISMVLAASSILFMGSGVLGVVLLMVGVVVWVGLVNRMKNFMREKGVSKGVNTAVTIGLIIIVTFVWTLGSGYYIFRKVTEQARQTAPENHPEEMLLQISELTGEEQERYTAEKEEWETVFLKKTQYRQNVKNVHERGGYLYYTVYEVKQPFLMQTVKNSLLRTESYEVPYREAEAAEWGAERVYQQKDGETEQNSFLLCRDDRIVTIETAETPNEKQKKQLTEKLFVL